MLLDAINQGDIESGQSLLSAYMLRIYKENGEPDYANMGNFAYRLKDYLETQSDETWEALLSQLFRVYVEVNRNLFNDSIWVWLWWRAAGDGNTPLVAQLLLVHKVNVNVANPSGETALMWAAQNGHAHVVELLLQNKADVNAADQTNTTALMMAARNGNTDAVQLLLAQQANVNATDRYGETALMMAADYGHALVVKALLKAGADAYKRTNLFNGWRTALGLAKNKGHLDVVAMLEQWIKEAPKFDKSCAIS